ncbi:MAG: glycosyltransferase, partial [Lachnospiraceae bacterium]|nr:glycosyltransferase [Lachnospiraceae bacterium]
MPGIDILVSQGGQGGVENVVNRTAVYLQEHGWRVRILQFADTGYHWTDHRLEWHSFWTHDKKIEFDPIIEEIKDFYRGSGTPDIVLATTWPLLNTVAAIIRGEIGASYKIGSWMHAALKKYDDYGWGGARELSAADFHLAINREIETEIRADIPDAVIYAVNNPIEMERICFSDKRDPKQFAVVCRLDPLKNVIQVVKAMERLDGDARLHVVGTGDEYGNILAYIEENGLTDRVMMHGWKDDPWELLKNVGTLVSASEEETGPLVAVEALLCGMPV